MARRTGLEPATPGVTGRYSNQLSYHRRFALGFPKHQGFPWCVGVLRKALGGVKRVR